MFPPRVVRTLLVGDEPRDIVFAGPGGNRAFITTAHRGQNTPWRDGDYDVPGVGRADVWVFDATNLGTAMGGTPLTVVNLFGDRPRALAASPTVLLMDEPAAGLDPRARIELREMIRALADDGKTILISSHILTELAEICDVVGIIERGQLIVTGSVEDIQRQCRKPQNLVEVRLIGDVTPLTNWLSEQADVSGLLTNGNSVTFTHAGDPQAEADLLRSMIEAGFSVLAFGSQQQTLEDVFMHVTKGLVQ